MNQKTIREAADEVAKKLTDSGKLIEAGWVMLRSMSVAPDAPQVQIDEMRMAFFAGAQHLFGSIMGILDPGDEEPTESDMRRMDSIALELQEFVTQFKAKHGLTDEVQATNRGDH